MCGVSTRATTASVPASIRLSSPRQPVISQIPRGPAVIPAGQSSEGEKRRTATDSSDRASMTVTLANS